MKLTKLVGAFAVGTAPFIVSVGSIEYENGLISIEQQVPYGDLLQNWVAECTTQMLLLSVKSLIIFLEMRPAITNACDQ